MLHRRKDEVGMKTRYYNSVLYKLAAVASHIGDTTVWPYYAERLKRRLTGRRVVSYSAAESENIYGPHVYSIENAFRVIGLGNKICDPRLLYSELFERAEQQVERLGIPFGELGIAGSGDLRLIYSAAKGIDASNILETGVALGWSSLVLLKAVEPNDGKLTSVDLPYPYLIGSAWVGAAVPKDMRKRWTLLQSSDRKGVPAALRLSQNYDLIHYDSDKSIAGRNWAYPQLWDSLRPGGLLLSDDIGDNRAWWNFCVSVGVPLIIVRRDRALAGIARKPFVAHRLLRDEAA